MVNHHTVRIVHTETRGERSGFSFEAIDKMNGCGIVLPGRLLSEKPHTEAKKDPFQLLGRGIPVHSG
jgi:hypothetical protein